MRIATYNAHLLPEPVGHDGWARVRTMEGVLPKVFADADVIVLQELISPARTAYLLAALGHAGWQYQTAAPKLWWKLSGGVHIVSRHPITAARSDVYDATSFFASDFLTAKGAVYARVVVPRSTGHSEWHIFGTHMFAPSGTHGDGIRAAQLRQLHSFVRAHTDPGASPVQKRNIVVAGDFNSDLDHHPTSSAVDTHLACVRPQAYLGDLSKSVDKETNMLTGIDGHAYAGSRLIDGVLLHSTATPRHYTNRIVRVTGDDGVDLSDHHAVIAEFTDSHSRSIQANGI